MSSYSKWEPTGLLKGLSSFDGVEVSELLEKATYYINEDFESSLILSIVRRCWELSRITDIEWLANDFKNWLRENQELLEYRAKNCYMPMDNEVETTVMYSEEHGNRYMKQHKLGRK